MTFKGAQKSDKPLYAPSDCTIIIPTINPRNPSFLSTVEKALANQAHEVLIVTVGNENIAEAELVCEPLKYANWQVVECAVANKREQIVCGVKAAKTDIVVTIDDHVFLGPGFLKEIVPLFENPNVGAGVGTKRRVVCINAGFS
jgi:cellulose synthase/poly-beta-1,6-N-acetylglucosamine synthase-like glycosyltransferase